MITGPESCGSSQLIQRTIEKAHSSGLHVLDCDRHASSNKKGGVLNGFLRSSGYNMMPTILVDLKLGRSENSTINDEELELCMEYYNQVSVEQFPRSSDVFCCCSIRESIFFMNAGHF